MEVQASIQSVIFALLGILASFVSVPSAFSFMGFQFSSMQSQEHSILQRRRFGLTLASNRRKALNTTGSLHDISVT